MAACTGMLMAQHVREDCMDSLRVVFTTPRLQMQADTVCRLTLDGYHAAGQVGAPSLPVRSDLLVVPFCDSMVVTVRNAVYDTLTLPSPLAPQQAPASKSGIWRYSYDSAAYAQPGFHPHPLVEVVSLGIARDRNLALMSYRPVWVNTAEGRIAVCRSAEVTVRYRNADAALTRSHYARYHTPAFGPGATLNSLLSPKGTDHCAPVRLTVLAAEQLRCHALDEFVQWKRTQGMLVDLIYVAKNMTADAVAAIARQLFDDATADSPAPAYLLLVGDHDQLQAFNSNLPDNNIMHRWEYSCDDHITDHYFTTFTGDMLPDCHRGRFSATDTVQLRHIVDKTLLYERYLFDDDSYLGRAALVAGVDRFEYRDPSDWAFACADPTMDYAAYHYVNADHGFTDVTYHKNAYNYAPQGITVTGGNRSNDTASALRQRYAEGLGWINYSAHGDEQGWSRPAFSTQHIKGDTTVNSKGDTVRAIAGMNNFGKPSFMIGNCCLTNHFNTAECFGEALLRRGNNAGAAAYIGCTNSSFWEQDFYWSVGVRDKVYNNMDLSYKATRRGMYDHLFHTQGEPFSKQAVTAGAMLTAGVMSVNSVQGSDEVTLSMADYYWEIYQLMGDPTLMPWLGKAKSLTGVTIDSKPNEGLLAVRAPYGAYVAMVQQDSLQVVAAAYAWADGYAYLPLDTALYADCFVSITAQGYKPYRKDFAAATVAIDTVGEAPVTVAPNPAAGRCTVTGTGLRAVSLYSAQGREVLRVQATGDKLELPLGGVPAGLYLLRVETAAGTAVRRLAVM